MEYYAAVKEVYTFLAWGTPFLPRWCSQGEIYLLHYECANPFDFPKCEKFNYIFVAGEESFFCLPSVGNEVMKIASKWMVLEKKEKHPE